MGRFLTTGESFPPVDFLAAAASWFGLPELLAGC
jgi:hypothetical protein